MRSAALESAYTSNLEVADQIKITRGYYTQNVVTKVKQSGALTASFMHKDDPKAIPLPATFVKDISDLLKERATTLSLVSPYPWPHHADRKLDVFEQAAWDAFQKDPGAIFSRLEIKDGQRLLRVAVADRMTSEACVSCHNTDPQSVKRDWKLGDVRAVMEVTKVVEPYLLAAEQRSRNIVWFLVAAASLAALALITVTWLVDRRTREKDQSDQRLRFLAHHDALTGLPNRALLAERLASALADSSQRTAVFCMDLDRFKEVNDTLGHMTGDALLKAVALRLRNCIKSTDTIARLGGDEFVIVQSVMTERADATALAQRICDMLTSPFDANGHQIAVQVSIGLAVSPDHGTDAEELLKNADLAAYHAKSTGHGGWCMFQAEMNTTREARRKLEADLRKAHLNSELELFYQPIFTLANNELTGFEALLRWRCPERGLVPPGDFIPVAEETGLIDPIGEWVIREACAEANKWPSHLTLSINLSAAQFKNRRLVQTILIALATTGLLPTRLELEVTESVLVQDEQKVVATLNQLRHFGVRVALDDFGTGFSSLSYLRTYPFDRLKIDRCFVSDLRADDNSASAIIRAAVDLGRSLGMATTAEGVETKDQLEKLRTLGCGEAQGYFFGAPKPVSEIASHYQSEARAA